MFRRLCAALAASALIAGLLGPTSALANDSTQPTCDSATVSTNEDQALNSAVSCSGTESGDQYQVDNDVNHGTLTLAANDGSFTYTPTADYYGSDTFTYHLTDPDGDSAIETISIDVVPVNDPPSFTEGSDQTVLEDAGAQHVANWATNIDKGAPNESGDVLTFAINSNSDATLFSSGPTVDSGGDLRYTPAPDANGSATIVLHAHDDGGGTANSPTATLVIHVTPVNDAPSFTNGGNQSVSENAGPQTDSGWASSISEGPADEGSQTVSFIVTNNNNPLFSAQPAVSPSGTLTYTPTTSASGNATVSVTAKDNGGTSPGDDTSSPQTFTITVSGVNDPPSFTKGGNQVDLEDAGSQSVPGWATAVNPGPGESGQTVTFLIDSNTNPGLFASGPAVNGTNGNLAYTLAANANGAATIGLHAHDDGGGATDDSAIQTFTITVTAVNDVPSFTKGGPPSVAENAGAQTVTGWATAISEGPANEASQAVLFIVTNNNNPLFSAQPAVSPTGVLTFTPATSANGSATVTVAIKDNGGTANGGDDTSNTQTFTITVSGINDPPSFLKGANQTVLEDPGPRTVAGWATAIIPGPPDESGQTVTFVVTNNNNPLFASQPAVNGSNGNLTYTPALNANGSATVTVFAQDNGGVANGGDNTSAAQTFSITVTPVNDPPSFLKGPDQTVLEDSLAHTVSPWASALSEGPPDEVAQTLTFVVVSDNQPSLFSVLPSIGSTGVLTYSLAPNANGVATIGVELHDNGTTANGGDDTSTIQTFKITVTPQNDVPTCAAATSATFVGTALNSTLTAACTDIDGAIPALKFSLVAPPISGTASVDPTGSFIYTPNPAFQGNDSFTFKANDGTVDSNVVTMSILVSPDPIAKNDVAPTDFPAIVQGSGPTAIPVLANDQDKQGGPLTIMSVTRGTKGTVAITGGGTGLTYDPTGFATGTDSFRYTIIDNQSRTNSATVVVVISRATPTGASPMTTIVSPATLGTTTARVRIIWRTINVGTGLKSYTVQESYNGGAFRTVRLARARSTSALRTLTFGKSYRYRLRVTDSAGNISPWAISPTFVIGRSQETAVGIAYSGSWALASSATYSGGKARWARAAAASATFSFNGEGVAWVSSKGRTRGAAQVLIDGVLMKTVSLFASRRTARQVVFRMAWPTMGLHTIQIVVIGTAGHPRVDLDTFVLAK